MGCGSMMANIKVETCGHIICRPCMLSSCICMKADCFAPVFPFEELPVESGSDTIFCTGCKTFMSLADKDCTLPCPHSVSLCTSQFPEDASLYHSHIVPKKPTGDGTQYIHVPKALNGRQTFCSVAINTSLLWNADLSVQLLADNVIRINHCSRNLRVRLNTNPPIVLYRGQLFHSYRLTEKLHSLTIFPPDQTIFKPGPCKFLRHAAVSPEQLTTEAFQYFTLPVLNPVLCNDTSRGILTGARDCIAGVALDDIKIASSALQCVRCRRVWPLLDESSGMQAFVDSCAKPGLLYGHLQPVVQASLSILPYAIPQHCEMPVPFINSIDAMAEAYKFVWRWRLLPFYGEEALALPDIVLVIGDAGLIDPSSYRHESEEYPPIDRARMQEILLSTRSVSDWQHVPHNKLVHFVHIETRQEMFATTLNHMLFFNRG